MAGLAAGGAEAVAPAVANWLFGSNPDVKKDAKGNVIASELTADQKNTLSHRASAVSKLVAFLQQQRQ